MSLKTGLSSHIKIVPTLLLCTALWGLPANIAMAKDKANTQHSQAADKSEVSDKSDASDKRAVPGRRLAQKAEDGQLQKATRGTSLWGAENFTLNLPVQVDLVGLAGGIQPELLWRPFGSRADWFHLRASLGFTAGPELVHLTPLSLGIRLVFLRGWRVQPLVGVGIAWQLFLPYGGHPANRLDMTMELGVRVKLTKGFALGLAVSPEFGLAAVTPQGFASGFGLGMASRLFLSKDLPW